MKKLGIIGIALLAETNCHRLSPTGDEGMYDL